MTNTLLVEAGLFAYDTFANVANYPSTPSLPKLPTGNAVDRGWVPLALPGLASPGVDLADVGLIVGQPAGTFTSAAHFYTGDLEGKNTLVVTYRSTDEPNEFAFQGIELPTGGRGWDLYFAAHQDATVAALGYAANPANAIEQVLISGHSLGGIVAELSTARLVGEGAPFAALADRTLLVTLGSPGSTEVVQGVEQLNLVHTDDFVARLSDLSPLFIQGGAAREGLDLLIDRPEATLPRFKPKDLDTPEELIAASQIPGIGDEHPSLLYIDTAFLLDAAESYVPGVSDAPDDPFRWLAAEFDRTIVGAEDQSLLLGTKGSDLVLPQTGDVVVLGREGDDVLVAAGLENTALFGGKGNDILVGGIGETGLFGGKGNDTMHVGGGNTLVDGGGGTDRAVFSGAFADFTVTASRKTVLVNQEGDTPSATVLRNVALLEFDDQTLAFDRGVLKPVEPAPVAVASVGIDDLVITGDVA